MTCAVLCGLGIGYVPTTVRYVAGVRGEQVSIDIQTVSSNTTAHADLVSVAPEEGSRLSAVVPAKRPATPSVSAVPVAAVVTEKRTATVLAQVSDVFTVPFFSQFKDISATKWRKVGCGVASLAMLIDYYKPGEVTVDTLLDEGLDAGAYLSDAGWIHQGLVNLADDHGLSGSTHDFSSSGMDTAFANLTDAVGEGPVIASVHYTFDPKNPIPHLVVVRGVSDGKVYYNDPAAPSGNGSISIEAFKKSWKKRYIEVRPA